MTDYPTPDDFALVRALVSATLADDVDTAGELASSATDPTRLAVAVAILMGKLLETFLYGSAEVPSDPAEWWRRACLDVAAGEP